MVNNVHSIFKEIRQDLETVKRHLSIVQTLLKEQPVGIIRISQETKIPEHKIRYSLRVLEREGVISPSREGAILTPEFVENKDQLANEAKELAEEMESMYQELKATLTRK